MRRSIFQAGSAAASVNEAMKKYFSEEGYVLRGEKGQQKIRCLLLDDGNTVTALFNTDWVGDWKGKFVSLVQQAIEAEVRDYPVQLLFAATHNHTGPVQPKPIRGSRKRHWVVKQTLDTIVNLFRQAYANRREAFLKVGSGIVESISANSDEMDGDFERNVYVLRIDDVEDNLIAAVVNFPCHPTISFGWCSEGRSYLSADFPGVMEDVVQRVYGDIPVLFINGAAGDMHPVLRRIPLDFDSVPRNHYEQEFAKLRWREIQRIGRVLGGEVCKVLAELEVAGETLVASCSRWGYVEFEKQPKGLIVSEPAFILRSRTVLLPRTTPSLEACEQKVEVLEEQIKQYRKEFPLPYPPNQKAKYLLRREAVSDPLFELMRLNAELDYWKTMLSRARNGGRTPPVTCKLSILGISREVGVVCFPGEMFHETAEAIRRQSPFKVTLIFGYITYPGEGNWGGYLTTAKKLTRGGYHSRFCVPEAEQEVIRVAIDLLSGAWETFR